MERPEEQVEGEKVNVDDCHESEIYIYDIFAVAKNWKWLVEKADLIIANSQLTDEMLDVTREDQKFRSSLNLKRGFKFPITMDIFIEEALDQANASGLGLHYLVVWDVSSSSKQNVQATGPAMDERQLIHHCIRAAIEAVANEMTNTATGTKWIERNTNDGYSSPDTFIKVFAEDVDTFHEKFQQQLLINVGHALPEISGLEILLTIDTRGLTGEQHKWKQYWIRSNKFRSENFEEVAISAKKEICRRGFCLYWDNKHVISIFDNTCVKYYPGFLINCCGKFEWKWKERDHAAAFGEDVTKDMLTMATGLRAYSQFGKRNSSFKEFRGPFVVRLLKGNGPIASLEKFLEIVKMCHDELDFIKANHSYDSCIKAVMEVDLAVRVVGTDWLDAGFSRAYDHLEAIEDVRCITLDEFWIHQGLPARVILNTLCEIVAENINQKRIDPGFCADFEQLQLAAYCEALLSWFAYGKLEDYHRSGFDVEDLANTLDLKPSTFSTQSGLYGHYVEALGFARNAVRVVNEKLVFANH